MLVETQNRDTSTIYQRFRESLRNLWRAFLLVWHSSRGWTIASLGLALVQGIMPIIILYLTGVMIDTIGGFVTNTVPGQGASGDLGDVFGLIALIGFVTFLNLALGSVATVVREGQALTVSEYVMSTIHAKSIAADLEYYESAMYHDRLHRVQQTAPFRPQQIVDNLLQVARDGFTLVGITGLLISLNAFTPLILFVSAFPTMLVRLRFARLMFDWQQRSAETERKITYYNFVLTHEVYAKEVRLFDIGKMFIQRYGDLRKRLRFERMSLVRRRAISEILVQLLSVIALFTAFALVASDALRSVITIGELVIAFQAFQRGQSSFQGLLGSFTSLYESNLFFTDFYTFLGLEPRIHAPRHPVPVPQQMGEGIRFENVSFAYSRSATPVLESINLAIKPGEIVALVGENGAGKTTLIKLLCRLYDPTQGRITLDGIDLREFDVTELRRMITVLFQDFNIYQLAAWENIWLSDIHQEPVRERIVEAARASGADSFISQLPQGYDSQLGNWFSNGRDLSVGQWQKIGLARAFLRDTQLIILDEPTSSLDVMAEHDVFERFRTIAAGKSGIIISHRLSTIRMASHIYVLDGGHIAECGTHDELMALDGIYAKLFRTQSKYYRS
jgi:ATP-binding cassette subfamily B protein